MDVLLGRQSALTVLVGRGVNVVCCSKTCPPDGRVSNPGNKSRGWVFLIVDRVGEAALMFTGIAPDGARRINEASGIIQHVSIAIHALTHRHHTREAVLLNEVTVAGE